MSILSRRVLRLEEKRPDSLEPVDFLLVNFVDRDPDGNLISRPGFAQFLGRNIPTMHAEDGESIEAFDARAQAALQADKAREASQ